MSFEQVDSTYQDEGEPHQASDDMNDLSRAHEYPVDTSAETIPNMLHDQWQTFGTGIDTVDWVKWLPSMNNILNANDDPELDRLATDPFMSTLNSLDNPHDAELTSSNPNLDLMNFNFGENTEYTTDSHDPSGGPKQENPYQNEFGTNMSNYQQTDFKVPPTGLDPQRVQAMMDMEALQPLREYLNPSSSTTLPGLAETMPTPDSMNSSMNDPAIPPRVQYKVDRDAGIESGLKHQGDSAETASPIKGDENSTSEANSRKHGLKEDEETQNDQSNVRQKLLRCSGQFSGQEVLETVDNMEWEISRPKYCRKNADINIKFRCQTRQREKAKMHASANEGVPLKYSVSESVSRLFEHLSTTLPPKVYVRRKKGTEQPATPVAAPLVTPTATGLSTLLTAPLAVSSTAISAEVPMIPPAGQSTDFGSNEAGPSTGKRPRKIMKPRPHVSEDVVRAAAPEGWDPYENDFYSGDDNMSDDGIEIRGKASSYKPPRMACRRCSRFKQPCDHKYPSCSLCAKYGQRCRYRDDLTGRQIRPGQLEAVEEGYHRSQQTIRHLEEELEEHRIKLRDADNRIQNLQTTVGSIVDLKYDPEDCSKPQHKQEEDGDTAE